jgi:hypothetical protein
MGISTFVAFEWFWKLKREYLYIIWKFGGIYLQSCKLAGSDKLSRTDPVFGIRGQMWQYTELCTDRTHSAETQFGYVWIPSRIRSATAHAQSACHRVAPFLTTWRCCQPKGKFTHAMPSPCRSPAMPYRVNSHMPCHAPAILRQCRVLRESPRGSRKYPNRRVLVPSHGHFAGITVV